MSVAVVQIDVWTPCVLFGFIRKFCEKKKINGFSDLEVSFHNMVHLLSDTDLIQCESVIYCN